MAVFAMLLLVACVPEPPEPPQDLGLIDNTLWQEVASDEDPLSEHRPAEVSCPAGGAWGEEDASLEVDTGLCNYLAVQQLSLGLVDTGDLLKLVMWHAQLWDFEVAEAHFALLFRSDLAWEVLIPVPSDPGIYDVEFESPVDLAEGEPIHLHLHNHGSNTWNFLELSVVR
jgi:hypothetical protein